MRSQQAGTAYPPTPQPVASGYIGVAGHDEYEGRLGSCIQLDHPRIITAGSPDLWDVALPGLSSRGRHAAPAHELQGRPALEENRSAATPPAVPQNLEPGTVAVDLTRAHDSHDFRPDVTRDQKIHVHIDLGRVFETRGNFEAALMEYQQALEACEHKGFGRLRSTDEALAERRIAGALDRLGRFSQAEVHYKKAIRLSPRDPKIWNDTGYSYYLQGRWADAERTFKTALRYAPDDPRITTNLGLTLAAAGRTKEALPLLSRFTGDAIGHANLGYPAGGDRSDGSGARPVSSGPGPEPQPSPGPARPGPA